jgi:hypothetical protein
MQATDTYKTCPKCSQSWNTLNDFLTDSSLDLNGYQVSFKNLDAGLLLFTHMVEGCKTTMGVYVRDLGHLYTGVRYTENKALSPECPRYCVDEKRLGRCDAHCECAYVREIIGVIKDGHKVTKPHIPLVH